MSFPARVIGQVDKDARVEHLTGCGDDHVCWTENTTYDAKNAQVAGANVAKGGKIWRVAVPGAETLAGVGDNVLATQATAQSTLIDSATGKAAWSVEGVGARLDGGNMLFFSRALTTTADDPSLAGRHLGDNLVQLGPLAGVRSASCSWNTEVIACIADKDLRWQRFAAG